MRPITVSAAIIAFFPSLIFAHGFVRQLSDAGKWFSGSDPVWYYYQANGQALPVTAGWDALNQDNGFVSPSAYGTSDIACHKNATAGRAYANVTAGDTVVFHWNTWPDTHKGPIVNYLAACNGECTAATAGSLKWTKISQGGLITPGGTGTWVTDTLIANNFSSGAVIPKNLKAGSYVIRHEIIALHGGENDNGAQNYPQCLNLKVAGSGTVSLPTGTAGTALYTRTDPGILFNLYTNPTSYPFPGPSVWEGAN